MKNILLPTLALMVAFASCTQSKYATTGPYESDDVYYTTDDKYIADFALVDDEAQMAATRDTNAGTSDDYYDPNYSAPSVYSPNSYNNMNNYSPNPWGSNSASGSSGFGNYNYGCFMGSYSPTMGIGWSPYSGYYSNVGFGYSSGMTPYCNNFYSPYNSWYTPYFYPNYYTGWAYNSWYSPINYNSTGLPYYGNQSNDASTVLHGPRNPISTNSSHNSAYSGNLFYNGVKKDNKHNYVQQMNQSAKTNASADHSTSGKPQPTVNSKPAKPTANTSQRPVYKPTQPAEREINRNVKPGFKPAPSARPSIAPSRSVNPMDTKPTLENKAPKTEWPTPSRATPQREEHKPPRQRQESYKPSGHDSTPSRSSLPSSTPSRSTGGGSSNSPRHK